MWGSVLHVPQDFLDESQSAIACFRVGYVEDVVTRQEGFRSQYKVARHCYPDVVHCDG